MPARSTCLVALVWSFQWKHYSDWIIHNMGSAEDKGLGNARIVIQSRLSDMPDVWIEPLKQFIRNMEGEK